MNIKDRFIHIRKILNKSQKDFSIELNTNQQSISDIERGIKNISVELMEKFCVTYNVNANWLLNGEGDMFTIKTVQTSALIDQSVSKKYKNKDDQDLIKSLLIENSELKSQLLSFYQKMNNDASFAVK